MKQEDQLFSLIQSLSKNEKGYFKKHASKHTDANNNSYVKLFNCIEKQKIFDEDKIKKEFSGDSIIKNFSASKNYLYNSIMKSLRAFHDENSIDSTILNLIKNVEILYKKTLFKQCENYLNKAEDLAVKYDRRVFMFEINSFQYKLANDQLSTKKTSLSIIEERYAKQVDDLEVYRNVIDYQFLNIKNNFILSHLQWNRKTWDDLLKSPLLEKDLLPQSNHAGLLYYGLLAAKEYYYNHDYKAAYYKYTNYLNFFEANLLLIEQEPNSYYLCLRNLSQAQLSIRKFDEFNETIIKLENSIREDSNSKLKVISTVISLKFIYYIFSNKTKEGIDYFYQNESLICQNADLINNSSLLAMYDSISLLFFFDNKYSDALVFVNEILNDKSDVRIDVKCFSNIINLFIHFELGNFDHIEYILKSVKKFIEKNLGLNSYAQPILEFMEKAVDITEEREMKANFVVLYNEIEKYKNELNFAEVFHFFDLTLWPKSKILGIALPELKAEYTGFEN